MNVKDWLGEENQLGIDIATKKYIKNESFDEFIGRISNNNPELKRIILEKKYLHGGRTLSNYNTGNGASTSNCYSSGYCPDDTAGILELNKNIGLTYKAQGGQGLSLSKIRPKGCKISKGGYETDGIIPFMQMFDTTTASISQGGSRKGALMMSLDCWHKEVKDFITIKTDTNLITKANLSVEIDNEFMTCVKKYYDEGLVFEKQVNFTYDGGETRYMVKPIEVYQLICKTAHEYAEPGIIYTEQFRNYNLMQYDDEYQIVTGNPCGEQPLPQNGACNLGSINLAEFVKHPYSSESEFDFVDFRNTVEIAIRALDDVLDYGAELHALPEQREMAKNYRNIGLGIMGLASMLFKMGIKYGSDKSLYLVDTIGYTMFRTALETSAWLAKEKGTFPKYKDVVFDAEIIKAHFNADEIAELRKYGLRNCSLLSIAPSGSIGTMLNVTTGCEPAFRLSYKRKTESLHKDKEVYYDVFLPEIEEFKRLYPNKELPEYFVSSENICWADRVKMQSVLQKHIDTAISSTVNLPNSATIEDVEDLYLYAWEQGLKGITIYRDGCARTGILTTDKTGKKESPETSEKIISAELPRGYIMDVSDDLIGYKRKLNTGCGSIHMEVYFDEISGEPQETFVNIGSSGGCERNYQLISRLISLALRGGVPIESIIDQTMSIRPCTAYINRTKAKGDTSKGTSCPSAIGYALQELQKKINDRCFGCEEEIAESECNCNIEDKARISTYTPCPECSSQLQFEGGCIICKNCGWSKCD